MFSQRSKPRLLLSCMALLGLTVLGFSALTVEPEVADARVFGGAGTFRGNHPLLFPRFAARQSARSGACNSAGLSACTTNAAGQTTCAVAGATQCTIQPDGSVVCENPQAPQEPPFESYAKASDAGLMGGLAERRAIQDRERRLTPLQNMVYRKLQANPQLLQHVARDWNQKYAEKFDPNNWAQILDMILKYLPQFLELLFKYI